LGLIDGFALFAAQGKGLVMGAGQLLARAQLGHGSLHIGKRAAHPLLFAVVKAFGP